MRNLPANQDIYTASEHDRKYAESQLELARLQAATYLPQLLEVMVDRALDPQAKSKDILDASEFTYKVSGLAKRQEEVKNAPTFQVKIVLPGQNREITIGGGSAAPEPTLSDEESVLDQVPSHVKTMKRKRTKAASDQDNAGNDLVFDPEGAVIRPVAPALPKEPFTVMRSDQTPDFSTSYRAPDAIDLEFGDAINNLNFDDID